MTEKLKSCPFCGCEASVLSYGGGGYDAKCRNPKCSAEIGGFDTEAEAIAAWNTRAAATIGKVQIELEPVLRGTPLKEICASFSFYKINVDRLRSEITDAILTEESVYEIVEIITNLQDERNMLRKLVRDMYRFIHAACEKYPRMFDPNLSAGGQMVREMPDVRYANEMRELGIMEPQSNDVKTEV